MNNPSRFSNRPPLASSNSAMNSKVLSRVTGATNRKNSPAPSALKKPTSRPVSGNSLNRSVTSKTLVPKAPEAKVERKTVGQENVVPERTPAIEDLLKSTSNNIGELRGELMKLETSYLRLERERSKTHAVMPTVHAGNPYLQDFTSVRDSKVANPYLQDFVSIKDSKVENPYLKDLKNFSHAPEQMNYSGLHEAKETRSENPYLKDYKADLLKELKEENHKLTIAELRLHGDFERVREANKCLEAENVAFKDRIGTEKAQVELKELTIERLKGEKLAMERKLMELEKAKVENERAKMSDLVELSRKQEEVKRVQERLNYEKEEKQRFIQDLRGEIERNSRLQLDNEKLKIEGKNLVEMIESLKIEMQILKRNNEETLNYIRYS